MSWMIDEARVMPFLAATDRRDLLALLRRRSGLTGAGPANGLAGRPVTQAPKWKDFKDGKDFKDHKDNKDFKDWKDLKDNKDRKDSKDFKDTKDSKDFKDFKDGIDGAQAGASAARAPGDRPAGPGRESAGNPAPAGMGSGSAAGGEPLRPAAVDEDDVGAVLRASRVNRYLRAAGIVI